MATEAETLLIYADRPSPRLTYILDFVFKEQLNLNFRLVTVEIGNAEQGQAIINYSSREIAGALQIIPANLLFEKYTSIQKVEVRKDGKTQSLFFDDSPHFDLFASSFYLLSRYEEYLEVQTDDFGRFPHTASLAYRNGFLQLPLVDIWLQAFAQRLLEHFPQLKINRRGFHFQPTYDIDHAYFLKGKPLWLQAGSLFNNDLFLKLRLMAGRSTDPFDVYQTLDKWHQHFELDPVYFFLVARRRSQYDKNLPPTSTALQKLIQQTAQQYAIGLHPSWQSANQPKILESEKKCLESISKKTIANSRQHYIKMQLPQTYQLLLKNGITTDYSMGYGGSNGFRASTGSVFYWFDLENNIATDLRILPFCFMDANSFYELRQTAAETLEELKQYTYTCKKYDTGLCTIFHNNILGSKKMFSGWAKMYYEFLKLTGLPFSHAAFSRCS